MIHQQNSARDMPGYAVHFAISFTIIYFLSAPALNGFNIVHNWLRSAGPDLIQNTCKHSSRIPRTSAIVRNLLVNVSKDRCRRGITERTDSRTIYVSVSWHWGLRLSQQAIRSRTSTIRRNRSQRWSHAVVMTHRRPRAALGRRRLGCRPRLASSRLCLKPGRNASLIWRGVSSDGSLGGAVGFGLGVLPVFIYRLVEPAGLGFPQSRWAMHYLVDTWCPIGLCKPCILPCVRASRQGPRTSTGMAMASLERGHYASLFDPLVLPLERIFLRRGPYGVW
ncbi:hypothetical protein BV25DRAFT_1466792 [Artomyces pyxidatus]|uniref:Uncharacterized protein n=1 Tax=Artomyces pyxidatus TaxID=48021 RepID=A0ACB8SKR9_9AGAM|nr:hypothetical protein BV25DRAFT_1466792 [Artomyces pyxidatus]